MTRCMTSDCMGDFVQDHIANLGIRIPDDEVVRQFNHSFLVTAQTHCTLSAIKTKAPIAQFMLRHQVFCQLRRVLGMHMLFREHADLTKRRPTHRRPHLPQGRVFLPLYIRIGFIHFATSNASVKP
jgi:hypothetical protein